MAERRTAKCPEAIEHGPPEGPEGRCPWCGLLVAGVLDYRESLQLQADANAREETLESFLADRDAEWRVKRERANASGMRLLTMRESREDCPGCGQPYDACECEERL